MIARKIIYTGSLDVNAAESIYDIVRKIEITGEIHFTTPGSIVLDLEGDPSMIKLVQHQVENKVKGLQKSVVSSSFKNYQGLDFYR